MKVLGWTIFNTVMAKNLGQMVLFMKVNTLRAKSMERVFIVGTTDPSTTETGMKIKSRVSELIPGWMVDNTKANGSITTWMASAFTLGRMEDNIVVSTRMIRSMDMEFIHGQMAVCTQDTGAVENNMGLALIVFQLSQPNADFGRKANVLNGSMKINRGKLKLLSSTTKCTLEKQKVASPLITLLRSMCLINSIRELMKLLISSNIEPQLGTRMNS